MHAQPHDSSITPITFLARDGHELSGTRFAPSLPCQGTLIVAGATGVPQRFYRRFALHAAQSGYDVLTLDYRGVGASSPPSLRGFQANYLDWAEQDLAGAVDLMKHDGLPLYVVGHSFGGQAIGLLPNHELIAGAYVFGTGSGWHGWMSRGESIKVRLLWQVILPLLVMWKGYMPWSLLNMGEDLPKGVYRQWKTWVRHPHYFFDDPQLGPALQSRYAQVNMPFAAATSVDDPWAPPRSVDAFTQAYARCQLQRIDLQPQPGQRPIGHMGYFRAESVDMWRHALTWLAQHA